MAGGFLKSHRKMLDNPLFQGRVDWLGAWVWLFHKARWRSSKYNLGGKIITLERGQLVVSLAQLERAWGMSKKQIRLVLARLEIDTMIVTAKGTAGTVITICNYEEYQGETESEGTLEGTVEDTRRAHEGHTTERREEGKKKKEKKDSPKKGSRLSEDWTLPRPWGEWAVQQQLSEKEVRDQAARFHDYWIGVPGQKGVKLDWQATWRNWIRSAAARGTGYVNGGAPPRQQTASDSIRAELRAQDEAKAAGVGR